MERLWKSSPLDPGDSLQQALEDRLLGCGIAPSELLTQLRMRSTQTETVRLFQCILHQPLDDSWSTSHQCTVGEEDWTSYDTAWNVLARNADHAQELAIQIQSRCWPTPAEVIDVLETDDEYEETPVWFGRGTRRWSNRGRASVQRLSATWRPTVREKETLGIPDANSTSHVPDGSLDRSCGQRLRIRS